MLYLKVSEKPFTGFEYECKNLKDIYLENIHNIKLRHILFYISKSVISAFL